MSNNEDLGERLLRWDTQREECCAQIRRTPAALKILLKTKNDPYFLERWIVHHHKIAGDGNVIVFDNMSDNDEVLRIYEKYKEVAVLIRFPGHFGSVHWVNQFPDLYDSLAHSTKFFTFLDTDEFLVLFDAGKCHRDHRLSEFIERNDAADVFPGTWLPNTDWRDTRFTCGQEFDHLASGIAWGKPILRSKARLTGLMNHNIQLDQTLFGESFKANFFVLHMKNLSPEQRISSNIHKLVAQRFAQPTETAEAICSRRLDGITDSNIIRYVEEIRRLLPFVGRTLERNSAMRIGCLEILNDGSIQFYGDSERMLIDQLIRDPVSSYAKAILQQQHAMASKAADRI